MKRNVWLFITSILISLYLAGMLIAEKLSDKDRETVLDRKVHIEKGLVLDIPEVPRLCDGMYIRKLRINIGDCRLYCEQEGHGKPIVLLHGGPGATHHYFHPHFSQAKGFAKIIYYDQRGCGISDYEQGKGYSISQAVEDLDNLREALKIKKWIVLGSSYGGTLAQCYVLKYPERVAGLVLVGSSTFGLPITLGKTRQYDFMSPEEKTKIQEIYMNKSLSLEQSVFNRHLNGDWKRQNFYKPSREQLARRALYEWKHDGSFRSRIIESLNGLDFERSFDGCPIPILIMEGKWDLTWSADKPKKLHACFPGSKLVIFERSSHLPFEDEPEKFFTVLKDFVSGLPELTEARISAWKEQLAKQSKEK
jgi:proline iminopeptidase